jgi:hypothetical protein
LKRSIASALRDRENAGIYAEELRVINMKYRILAQSVNQRAKADRLIRMPGEQKETL